MALTIICVTGPRSSGKSSTVRAFTAKHLKYERATGDILGIFQMPRLRYAVGVTGSGDRLDFILKGQKFLTRYDGLRVMIVASRSDWSTLREAERFANEAKAILHRIPTKKVAGTRERNAAISANVAKMRRLIPGR